jgi:acetyl esterase/lipase
MSETSIPRWTPHPQSWTGPGWRAPFLIVLLAVSVVLAFLSTWVVLPAPNRQLLPFGVAVPELSPLLCLLAATVAGLCWWARPSPAVRQRWETLYRAALLLSLGAALVLLRPLAQLPGALTSFDAAAAAAGWTVGRPATFQREQAFSFVDLVRGVPRGATKTHRGVPVAVHGDAMLTADVYHRDGLHDAPVVVQVYGGAWQRGGPRDDEAFARYLASRGTLVVAVDYRHAPAARWPAQIEDVESALTWVRDHARDYGGNAARLALVGRSSGAQLALVAAYRAGALQIAGVVSMYGPVDLVGGWREPPQPDPLGVRGILETYLGGTPDSAAGAYRDASPLSYVSRSAPPTLLVYGARDHVVEARFGRRLDERLHREGVSSALLELPWAEHAFDVVPNGLGAQVELFYVERFLAHVFAARIAS